VATQSIESILRLPEYDTNSEPLVDPNAFLRQGDMVEDWDNLQLAWNAGMEALRAKDTLKHTKGGTPYTHSGSTTIHKSSTSSSHHNHSEGKCVHPLLAVTPGFTEYEGHGPQYCASVKRQQYVKYTEVAMESLEASSLFLAPAPMLAAFSVGRQTALVVDVGAGGCRVTPVVDGLLLKHSQRRNGRGGDWLGHVTWKALLEEKVVPKPRYQLRDSSTKAKSPLFDTWAMQDLMYEIRTEPHVSLDIYNRDTRVPFTPSTTTPPSSPTAPATPSSAATAATNNNTYELPDGTSIDLTTSFGKDLCRIPELLFTDSLPFSTPSSSTYDNNDTLSNAPLHQLIRESLLAVGDVDVRKELANCICLSGGASVVPNLDARLSAELSAILPAFCKPKVVASRNSVERSCASWIGASILTSLGSFQQLWLSRTEYEEYGATMSIQRFP
jgi:actin-related protein